MLVHLHTTVYLPSGRQVTLEGEGWRSDLSTQGVTKTLCTKRATAFESAATIEATGWLKKERKHLRVTLRLRTFRLRVVIGAYVGQLAQVHLQLCHCGGLGRLGASRPGIVTKEPW